VYVIMGMSYKKCQQYRQCTYNVILRRVRETIVVVEKRLVLRMYLCKCALACMRLRACTWAVWVPESLVLCICVRACTLAYPACKAHVPFAFLFVSSGSTVFFDIVS
jgi:hypothetical protein